MNELEKRLRAVLEPLTAGGACLAFSGGCDSATLLAMLARMRAEHDFPLVAVYCAGPFQTAAERGRAETQAKMNGVALVVIAPDPLSVPEVRRNARDRCYHCKRLVFAALAKAAAAAGAANLLDGTNADDLRAHRPGRRALEELGVISPLAQAGLTKAEVRELAAAWGVPSAHAPAGACLATRFPYDTELTEEELRRVEAAEEKLRPFAPGALRVRAHGDLARVEAAPASFAGLVANREAVTTALRALGFKFVTLDLEGFRSGSFDG